MLNGQCAFDVIFFSALLIGGNERFWFPMLLSVVILVGMILCATNVIPFGWRVTGSAWAVILPLS